VRWSGSRGQGKVVGVLLQIAAEEVVAEATTARAVWLVDDLDAELSMDWSSRLLTILSDHAEQMLVTSLPGKIAPKEGEGVADRMFHVEHGAVRG
jgi:recombinational DNA repair ATPase RecF